MNKLSHKGYYGTIDYSAVDEVLHGRVLNIKDFVSYEGTTIEEIKKHFVEAVDGYLQMCAELGELPDKPASGKFNVRIDPDLHRKAQERAAVLDISLNDIVANALQEYIEEHEDEPA